MDFPECFVAIETLESCLERFVWGCDCDLGARAWDCGDAGGDGGDEAGDEVGFEEVKDSLQSLPVSRGIADGGAILSYCLCPTKMPSSPTPVRCRSVEELP